MNCGAPVPSTHCAKNGVNCCWLCASATFSKSPLVMPSSVYWLNAPLRVARNSLSPISPRSMWKIIAPFSRVIDWNSGEKGFMRLALESGMVSYASAPAATSCNPARMAFLPFSSSTNINSP